MTRAKDLREYLAALDELGDVRRVDAEVPQGLEIGAFIRRSCETRAPAPLFNNISGTESGFRLLGAPGALSSAAGRPLARIALSLGMSPDAGAREIVQALAAARDREPVAPKQVPTAPCKQNVLLGDDASLARFPTPLLHEGDGGPYVNTWGTIIVRSPEGDWVNWSIARIMMLDDKHLTGLVMRPQHIEKAWRMWAERGEPMPFALVQGGDPALPFISGMPLPDDVDEPGFLGALFGEPMEVVPAETVDLQVPAGAEIVIEGHVSVERNADEGPMGEYAGYAPAETTRQPTYTIEAITHRDRPIWPTVVEGEPVDEFHTATGLTMAAEVYALLRRAGLPVVTAWSPFESASHVLVVSVRSDWRAQLPGVSSAELTRRISETIGGFRSEHLIPRTFVLDADVEPSNTAELTWALATRCHPEDFRVLRHGEILPLLTCYTPEERHAQRGTKVVHDCLLPAEGAGRERRSSFRHIYPEQVQHWVEQHWAE